MEFGWSPESDVIKSGAEGQSRTDTESPLPVLSLVKSIQISVKLTDIGCDLMSRNGIWNETTLNRVFKIYTHTAVPKSREKHRIHSSES